MKHVYFYAIQPNYTFYSNGIKFRKVGRTQAVNPENNVIDFKYEDVVDVTIHEYDKLRLSNEHERKTR